MAEMADIGDELFDRIRDITKDLVANGGWNAQPQHVRDAIGILLAMVRNRATQEAMLEREDGFRRLARQYENAHKEEMRQVARLAFVAAAGERGGFDTEQAAEEAFERWYRDHVTAPDGSGIRIR